MTRPDSRYRTDGEFPCIDFHVHRVARASIVNGSVAT